MRLFPSHNTLFRWLYDNRDAVRISCWTILLGPLVLYLLVKQDVLQDRPPALDVGIVAIAAALGGLILNAGLSLKGPKRAETIRVAQKFIYSVILMVAFVPFMHLVGLLDGDDVVSFEIDSLVAWVRWSVFWVAAASFYGSVSLFIFGLVDLAYALVGIESMEHVHHVKKLPRT